MSLNDAASSGSRSGQPVHERLAAVAADMPHAIAVIAPDGSPITYKDLHGRVSRLATLLRAEGVGRDVRVAIYLDRSPDLIVAVGAVLTAGGAYVPLDASYPPQRLTHLAEDSRALLVLTSSTANVDFLPAHVRRWNIDAPTIATSNARAQSARQTDSASLAYVIYTSGSTGRPKGVAMPHASLCNLIDWQNARSALPPGGRTLQFAPIGFDVSFQEIFATLTSGGTLVLIDEATRRDPERLARYIAARSVARLFVPFVALQQLVAWTDRNSFALPSLREVITAGEALRATPAIVSFFERHRDCTLDNQYGPTETHVVTAHRLTGHPRDWPALPPIGYPLPNVSAHVLDDAQAPVTEGQGELFIGGVALARGYLDNPSMTSERYLRLPAVSADVVYRTGDMVSRRADGTLYFLGRIDQQVKIRGHRIELAEVESVLETNPEVAACAVHVWTRGELDQRLVASVVPAPGHTPSSGTLRRFLDARLPDYMVPSAIVIVDRLPVTPSGKIDRAALAPPAEAWGQRAAIPPRDETERRLLDIWTELLGISGLGVTDDFFDSGGDSLLSVRLIVEIERRFGKQLPVSSIIDATTIERLAPLVRADRQLSRNPSVVTISDSGHGLPFFWIHGLGGGVTEFVHLGRRLGSGIRAYGIETPLDISVPDYAGSLPDTASHLVAALNAFYPSGPFVLGGWSAGATLGLEMAVQLEAQGRRPLAIVSFDGAPFNTGAEMSRWNPAYWLKVVANVPAWVADDLAHTPKGELTRRIRRKTTSVARRVSAGTDAAGHDAEIEGFLDIDRGTRNQQEFMRRQYHALRVYSPPPYSGRVILYRAKTHPLMKLHEFERVWRKLGADLELVLLRGTHLQVVEPAAVNEIADHLRSRLAALAADALALA